jgi:hypothetical protein
MLAKSWGEMGNDRIRYLVFSKGRWRWQPTNAMREHGFKTIKLSKGGPSFDANGYPAASIADKNRAVGLNADWDAARLGLPVQRPADALTKYPSGSVGDGYQRAMALRKAARVAAGKVWTVEQEKRDDWPRAWRWLEPEFGDCDPRTIEPEHFLSINERTGEARGLAAKVEREVSITERHRTVKVWRSLWKRMAAMKYCDATADPSKAFANKAPDPRQAIWARREVLKLVQVAWRNGFYGLAACMAVAWDSMFSPVDARTLTPAQCGGDIDGLIFSIGRAKTGKAAAGTLTQWSQAILLAYLQNFGADIIETSPLFRTRGGKPIGRKGETGKWGGDHGGGAHILPAPYTKNSLVNDFDKVRTLAFGLDEARQLSDMRRSGAVEGDTGGSTVEDQSNKMANTVKNNARLRKTYNPVNVPSVRRFDEARAKGAKILEQKPDKSISAPALEILLQKRKPAKSLK